MDKLLLDCDSIILKMHGVQVSVLLNTILTRGSPPENIQDNKWFRCRTRTNMLYNM